MDANEQAVAAIVAARQGKTAKRGSAKKPQVAPRPKAKVGRPRKYTPAMLDEVLLSASKGATWSAIGEACGIMPSTAQDWCNLESPRFNEAFSVAVTRAKSAASDAVLTSLFSRANGYDYQEEVATPSGRVVRLTKRLHPETAAAKSWLANTIGWRGETQRVESEDPLLGILAAMRGSDDVPAVPEAD